jgi:two-component system chemotaxis sensor kinase CheA
MMIEDDELRDIYKTATAERLQKLEASLLRLEKQPKDQQSLDEFLREAHTLKGDSRMLGVTDVETLTHQIEDCLASVKRGEKLLNEGLFDRLYQGLDAIRDLIQEAVTGAKAEVNVFSVLAQLMGADTTENLPIDTELLPEFSSALDTEKLSINSELAPELANTEVIPVDTLDTIRVTADKLDRLMAQAGELSVTKARILRQITDINSLLAFWEEGQKEAPISLENQQQKWQQLGLMLDRLKNTAQENTSRLDAVTSELESGVRQLRLLPLATLFNFFPRMVRDLAKEQGKEINLVIEGGEIPADKRIIEEMKDPLLHLLRNAIDHGIETPSERIALGKPPQAVLRLRGYSNGSQVGIEVSDDGRGLDLEKIKQTALRRRLYTQTELDRLSPEQLQALIFAPGFSTKTQVTEISGRGIGLDAVRSSIERLKGTLQLNSLPQQGCSFQIDIRATLATTSVLIIKVAHLLGAIPVESVETVRLISPRDLSQLQGQPILTWNERPITVAWLADLLGIPVNIPTSPLGVENQNSIACVLLKVGNERLALLVDEINDQQEVIFKNPCNLLKRVRHVTGSTILNTGEICTIFNPFDLIKSLQKGFRPAVVIKTETTPVSRKLLLVEDSIVIRTQMQRLLTQAGYEVAIATDGLEGLEKLSSDNFVAVVSDVEMPNLNGLAMTTRIRQEENYRHLPIILVTTLASETDKNRGLEVGASAYLTKGDFDQHLLLTTLRELIEANQS